MSLRSFKAYTNVAPVCPSMPIDPVGTLVKQALFPCTIVNFDGIAAAAGYFQVFDRTTTPTSTVTVPLMSVRIEDDGSGGPQPLPSFLPSLGGININKGLWFAMSSTEAVYTAVATNFDVWGAIEEFELFQTASLTAVGNLTAGVDHLQIWTEAAGPKKLVEIIVTDLGGFATVCYLMLFAMDSPTDLVSKPIQQWKLVANTAYGFRFGNDGIRVESRDTNYTLRKGCTLWLSDTTGVLVKPSAGETVALKAYYK